MEQPKPYRWVMLLLFVLLNLCVWMAYFAQAPLLAGYWGRVYHINPATANLLLSMPGLVGILFSIPTGRWVDRWGLRRTIGLAAICAMVGFGLRALFMTSFAMNAVLTVVGGYAFIAGPVTVGPLMVEWFGLDRSHTFIGFGYASFFVGGGLGILLTAQLIGPLGIPGTFLVYSVLLVIVCALWWLLARDGAAGPVRRTANPLGQELRAVLAGASARINLIVPLFVAGAAVFAGGFLPGEMAETGHLSLALAGTIASLFLFAVGVGLLTLPSLATRWGRRRTGIAVLVAIGVVWAVYAAVPRWPVAGLVVMAILLGIMFNVPVSLTNAIQVTFPGVDAGNRGAATGAFGTSLNVGVFILPVVMGGLAGSFGPEGGILAIIGAVVLGLIGLAMVREPAGTAAAGRGAGLHS